MRPIYSKSKSQKEDTPYIHNPVPLFILNKLDIPPSTQKPSHNGKEREKKTKTKKKNKNKTSYPRTKFIHNRALVRVIPNISCAGRAALSLGKTENEEEAGGGRRSRVVIPEYEISTEGTRVCPWP